MPVLVQPADQRTDPSVTSPFDETRVCGAATWVFVFQRLGPGVFSVESSGEVSLVDYETLERLLRQQLMTQGGQHEVGGDPVG